MVGSVYESTADLAVGNSYDERTVPSRIYECLPRVRLIAILRDPVERALSHYRMEVGTGRERRSFDDAVAELLRADALASARRHPAPTTGCVTWGEYGRILSGYFDVFPREQILVVFTDELARAPVQLLRRVQEFIGVRADFEPDNLGARYRVGATVRPFSWKSPSSWMSPASPLSPRGVTRSLVRNPTARTVWHAIGPSRQRRFGRLYQRTVHQAARRSQRPVASEAGVSSEPSSARWRDYASTMPRTPASSLACSGCPRRDRRWVAPDKTGAQLLSLE